MSAILKLPPSSPSSVIPLDIYSNATEAVAVVRYVEITAAVAAEIAPPP